MNKPAHLLAPRAAVRLAKLKQRQGATTPAMMARTVRGMRDEGRKMWV